MDLLPAPQYDDHWEGTVVGHDPLHTYLWLWYGYNIRVIAVSAQDGLKASGWDYAWCFPRDPRLVMFHLRHWNSWTQDEPQGWRKRPTNNLIRRAPFHDPADLLNTPRCEHGSYLGDECRLPVCARLRTFRTAGV